jgi:ABC-type dipeptide/oligopeptide/nickel transport system permease component
VSRPAFLLAIPTFLVATTAWARNAVHPGATGQKVPSVILDAGPVAKLFLLSMLIAAVAAIVLGVMARRRRSAAKPAGAGFVSSLRVGGVLLAAAVATWLGANILVRSNYDGGVPPFHIVSPGLAEITVVMLAGMLASAAAVFAHGAMSPRPVV